MGAVEKAKETRAFLEECWIELQKVTWPDMDQLRSATVVVIAFTIAISGVIWLMDKSAGGIINLIIRTFVG